MGYKAISLPRDVPARLVTVPGSSRIRVELEGSAPLGYDPEDKRLFVFGDACRRPVELSLSVFQARALLRDLARHAAERRAFYASASGQIQGHTPRPVNGRGLMRPLEMGTADSRRDDCLRPTNNVVVIQFRQVERQENDA